MNLCSDNHEEVCYEERHCPMCQLKGEEADRDRYIVELQDRIKVLENNFDEMCDDYESLKAHIETHCPEHAVWHSLTKEAQ